MNLGEEIAQKVRKLPLEKQLEVRNFVDFLIERALRDAERLREPTSTPLAPVDLIPVPAISVARQPEPVPISTNSVLPSTLEPSLPLVEQVVPMEAFPPSLQPGMIGPPLLTTEEKKAVGHGEIEEAVGEWESFWSSWEE